jgi:hypothetical protein
MFATFVLWQTRVAPLQAYSIMVITYRRILVLNLQWFFHQCTYGLISYNSHAKEPLSVQHSPIGHFNVDTCVFCEAGDPSSYIPV